MFKKILVANRGEIACRVMETAQRMGITCVAIYSEVDATARHVVMADESVALGGRTPAESYLRGEAVIAAALQTGAEAIHPGYGFLSENPDFVEAVEAAGLVFIGPSASAIRAMGLKDAAKALMEKAQVPVVPGYHGAIQTPAVLAQKAAEIGFPVLIKAVAGGGGKGMRRVETAAAFSDALQSAQGEALAAFGNADVLIEKYIQKPRHIEVQVFGDGTQAVHLFERDCSLQRRHQKVIEEAPAPGMTEEMRSAMGKAAVRAAEAIGYKGAGTVEFIVDASEGLRSDRFWFMEMNTRLQVEHPVTEMVTGVDLVAWQLAVAAGAPLPATQERIKIQGHAFEARLYAEDVGAGFLPATGRLSCLRFPSLARADTGVRAGDEISPYYDPMIAKLIVHGNTRAEALQKLRAALAKTEVAGTVTNLAFLGALAHHEDFAAGNVDTDLIARDLSDLTATGSASSRDLAQAALAIVAPGLSHQSGFHLWQPLRQAIYLKTQGTIFPVGVSVLSDTEVLFEISGETHVARRQGGLWAFEGYPAFRAHLERTTVTIFCNPAQCFEILDPLERQSETQEESAVVRAPMPGLLKFVDAAPGKQVQKGARLVILEAMKMEHTLLAPADGLIEAVYAAEGEQVAAGDILIAFAENS